MNASDIAILITALGSLVGAIVAGVALLRQKGTENAGALAKKLEDMTLRMDEMDATHENKMRDMNDRLDERDKHISKQDRMLVAFRRYTFELRGVLARNGIQAPDEPAELEPSI